MSDFDNIITELSADLDAATKAQTEPVLHPKQRAGRGLASIAAHIHKEFSKIHEDLAKSMREIVVCDVEVAKPKPRAVKVEKSLEDKAAIVLRDCERISRHVPVRRAGLHRSHYIVVPKESAAELIEQAMRVRTPRKAKR